MDYNWTKQTRNSGDDQLRNSGDDRTLKSGKVRCFNKLKFLNMKLHYELIDFEEGQIMDGKMATELEVAGLNKFLKDEGLMSRWVTLATANEYLGLELRNSKSEK